VKFPIYVHFVTLYASGVESNIDHITPLSTKTLSSILQLLTKELRKRKTNCNIFKY